MAVSLGDLAGDTRECLEERACRCGFIGEGFTEPRGLGKVNSVVFLYKLDCRLGIGLSFVGGYFVLLPEEFGHNLIIQLILSELLADCEEMQQLRL